VPEVAVVIAPRGSSCHAVGARLTHLDSVNIHVYVVSANTLTKGTDTMSKSTIRRALSIAAVATLVSLAPREAFAQG
jgi:hypothetical protein